MTAPDAQRARVAELRRARSRSPFLAASLAGIAALLIWAWTAPDPYGSVLTPERRMANLERFLNKIKPAPVRESGDWSDALPWAKENLGRRDGLEAVGRTLAITNTAAALAGLGALLLVPLASRRLSNRAPLGLYGGRARWGAPLRRSAAAAVNTAFLVLRSLPEFLLGLILLAILGPDPWALVLALAIHNVGILGRLGAEVTDNAPDAAARTALAHGGGRLASYATSILPDTFNRKLSYFFYRWETCVREATVLGMLGVVSLGYLIDDAKSARAFDRMVFFVLLGALIVLAGDLLSSAVRRRLRAP